MNNIILDFRYNYLRGDRFGAQEVVYQYDTGRVIEAYVPVEEDGFVLNIGWESDPVLSVIQADSVEAAEEGGWKILATIPDSILTKHGNLLVYIIAGDGDTDMVITTYEGVVTVRSKAVAEDYIPPDDPSMSILERCAIAANAAENAQGAAEAAQGGSEASALKSEGYAIGEQDGTPVSSGDYYQNNAKYYSEQASDEADAADASALKAEGYSVGKQNGTDVGSGSDYYHNNAKYYAEQAAQSAAAFVIDDTLSHQGEAADAKATGDAISALNSKITGSFTYSSTFTGPASDYPNQLIRQNNVVYLALSFWTASGKSMSTQAWQTIATIPSNFRPNSNIPCYVSILGTGHSAGNVYDGQVTSSGQVQMYSYTLTTIPGRGIIQLSYMV